MAFTVFHTGDTASATEVMNNFYHIFQGDRLPRGGANLDPTTGVYDIGSSAYKWNQLHCVNLNIDTISTTNKVIWKLIYSETISIAATSIEITGLNSSNSNEFFLDMFLVDNTATSVGLIFNGDSASNYGYISQDKTFDSGTSLTVFETTRTNTTTAIYGHLIANINSYRGYGTYINQFMLCPFDSTAAYYIDKTGIWKITATLTSIKFIASQNNGIGVGTTVNLFGRF